MSYPEGVEVSRVAERAARDRQNSPEAAASLSVTAAGVWSINRNTGVSAGPATATPADVASAGAVGTATKYAREDHAHRGVTSVAKSGSAAIYGAATFSASTGISLAQVGQDIAITCTVTAPAAADAAPADVGSAAAIGTSADYAREDHVHKGLTSIAKSGSAALYGAVTLSGGSNVTLTQSGQDISIAASGGGGGGTLVGCAASHSANVSCANSTNVRVPFDTEVYDTDGLHFTSAANLTGTVAKTNGSATLAGTGTLFTSELSVGQVIKVPGGADEWRAVTAIATDTSLTVSHTYANTASGQTAVRDNAYFVAPSAGKYMFVVHVWWAANSSGLRALYIDQNDSGVAASQGAASPSGSTGQFVATWALNMAQWDRVVCIAQQSSGGSLNLTTAASGGGIRAALWKVGT